MNRSSLPLTQILLALIAVLLLAILTAFLLSRKASISAPNLESLKNTLQKSAEISLPAPCVANEQITIAASGGDAEAAATTIVKQTQTLGGIAIKTTDDSGRIHVLVQIPTAAAARLREQISGKSAAVPTTRSDENQLIEVIVTK